MRTSRNASRASAPALGLKNLVPRDVIGALRDLGIDATERGDEALAACPNPDHLDRKPSWSCNLDTGAHHCFSCGFGGSFQYLTQKVLGVGPADAQSWVLKRKVQDIAEGHVTRRSARRVKPEPGLSEAELWRFTEPPAPALASRGLFADDCLMYDVRWDATREMWITPVRDPRTGKLWGWQEKNARHFNNYPRDIPKSRALFGYGHLPQGGTAFLVESPLDVPYVWPGCPDGIYPVSSYGAHVSAEQVSLLRSRCDRVILAFDNDNAGLTAIDKLAWSFGSTEETTPAYAFCYQGWERKGFYWYPDLDGRDPGNLSMDEIAWGIKHAVGVRRIR